MCMQKPNKRAYSTVYTNTHRRFCVRGLGRVGGVCLCLDWKYEYFRFRWDNIYEEAAALAAEEEEAEVI